MFAPDSIEPDIRKDAMRIGHEYASDKVLEQAKETLQACDKHGPKLADYGFGQPQIDELKEYQEDLESMGVEKLKAKAKGGVTGTTVRKSMVRAKKPGWWRKRYPRVEARIYSNRARKKTGRRQVW